MCGVHPQTEHKAVSQGRVRGMDEERIKRSKKQITTDGEHEQKEEDWWGGAAWSMEGLTERCWNVQANSIWGVIGTRKVGQR